ncbi:hypothetical protein GWD52_20000 [Enterobacteriaceae bacterium 4M9]|nr:hypothetical protein [Enterobacteriaceae bacterium 4M9]
MIQIASIIVFIIGVIVFILVVKKQKNEEEYYDRFYFIVSKHDTISEYLSLSNKLKNVFSNIRQKVYFFNEQHLSHTQFHELVKNAGYHNNEQSTLFYLSAVAIYLILLMILTGKVILGGSSFILFPVCSVIYYIALKMYLERRHKKEILNFRSNFVYFLDLMSTCIKTGMTLTASVDSITPLLSRFSPLLAHSIFNFSNTIKYASLEEACDRLYQDVPLMEVQEFNSTVKNSAQFGAGMHVSLQTLSQEIRQFHFIETEEKIGAVNAKMGIPLILFIMFPIIVEIILPGLLRSMQNLSLDMIS